MKKIMMFSAAHPGSILAVLGLITLAALLLIGELRVRISAESLLVKDTPAWRLYQQTRHTFGSDSITVVFLRDHALFRTDKLIAIRKVVEAIDALPFVERTSSLYSARNVRNADGFITTRPYLGEIPEDPRQLESIRRDAVQNPLVSGNLLSADATSMAINIYFRPAEDDAEFDSKATLAIEQAIAPLKGQVEEVFQIGGAYVRDALTKSILGDQLVIVPLSLAVLLLALSLSLRRLNGAVIPLLTAGLSVTWTLALMALLQIPVDVMTSIVPALLIIIGSTEDIHLLAEYEEGIAGGITRVKSVEQMSSNDGSRSASHLRDHLSGLSVHQLERYRVAAPVRPGRFDGAVAELCDHGASHPCLSEILRQSRLGKERCFTPRCISSAGREYAKFCHTSQVLYLRNRRRLRAAIGLWSMVTAR